MWIDVQYPPHVPVDFFCRFFKEAPPMIARRNFNQNLNRPTIRNVRGPAPRPIVPRGIAPRDIGSILTLVLDKYNVNVQTAKIQTVIVPAARPVVQQRFQF
jgi:hypothetical protein